MGEQHEEHGPVGGVTAASTRTGGTFSGCGVMMAGILALLAFEGSLTRFYPLGFALTFRIPVNRFLIRPDLVPVYLLPVSRGRFGSLSGSLGGASAATRHPIARNTPCTVDERLGPGRD
jgi:hypothetical protein